MRKYNRDGSALAKVGRVWTEEQKAKARNTLAKKRRLAAAAEAAKCLSLKDDSPQ